MWHRAKDRAGTCEVTVDWIMDKLIKNQCEITGLPFDLTPTTKYQSNPYAPSLDRIDAKNKHYTPENTRVVLQAVNITLNQYGEQTLLPILKAMVTAIEDQNA